MLREAEKTQWSMPFALQIAARSKANHLGRDSISNVCDHSCVFPTSDFKVNTHPPLRAFSMSNALSTCHHACPWPGTAGFGCKSLKPGSSPAWSLHAKHLLTKIKLWEASSSLPQNVRPLRWVMVTAPSRCLPWLWWLLTRLWGRTSVALTCRHLFMPFQSSWWSPWWPSSTSAEMC